MTILLYKNGQWLIDGEQPLEGVSLDNLVAILTNPKDGDVVKYDEASGMWVCGSPLPPVTSSDNGKVLAVKDGAWAAQKQVVTLYAAVNSSSEIILDDDNGYTFSELKAYAESGYSFICHLTSTGIIGLDLTCPVYPIEIRTYGIDFAGEAVLNTVPFTRAYVRFEVYEDGDNAYAISGTFGGGNKYIVTLTPTALDYSGTMDKTVAEINAAYEAGQEIVFRMYTGQNSYVEGTVTRVTVYGGTTYPMFEAFATMTEKFIGLFNEVTQDGTSTVYHTEIYALTPAS